MNALEHSWQRWTLVRGAAGADAGLGLGQDDLAAEVLKAPPDVVAVALDVERCTAEWTGTWARRFGA